MDLGEKLSILIQGCELAQKGGLLTLDEAVTVKRAIDLAKAGKELKTAVDVFNRVVTRAQKNGIYTFKDSYYLYLALDNIDADINLAMAPAPAPAPVSQPAAEVEAPPEKKKKK